MSASTVFAIYYNHIIAVEVEIIFILWIRGGRETKIQTQRLLCALTPSDLLCHSPSCMILGEELTVLNSLAMLR